MLFSQLSSIEYWTLWKKGRLETFQPTLTARRPINSKQCGRSPENCHQPGPKSVYLPVWRAPVSKFCCMSPRSAAFHIDSGQLRFAMMRNLTVILQDSNLGAWGPRQIDKTSLSWGRVVTFGLSTVLVRVIMIFFLAFVDSNTCDKIRTMRAWITCNNARNIDLRYLKGY